MSCFSSAFIARKRRLARIATRCLRCLIVLIALIAGSNSAQAQLYWDTNGTTPGFGTASGTWGIDAFWNDDNTGGAGTFSTITTTSDSTNFGNGATGLGAGTISADGTVNSGSMTFASGSGAITLSGGTVNYAATSTVTVNNSENTITSAISGAGTSLTKAGTGTLLLGGGGTMTGNLIVSAGTARLAADNGISTTAGLQIFAGASATRVLDLNGFDQTLSRFIFTPSSNSSGNLDITGGANSKLTITPTVDTYIGTTATSNGAVVTADMSGLGEFDWDGSARQFFVGSSAGSTATNASAGTFTALLAGTNTITASQIGISATGSNQAGSSTLRLGQSNALNANTINIGTNGRGNGTLNFRTGLSGTPTVTIRGTDGGSTAVTSWDVGRNADNSNSRSFTATVDFSTGEVDAIVTTLRAGIGEGSGRSGVQNSFFIMGRGTLVVETMTLGTLLGSGGVSANQFRANGTFTLNHADGLVQAGDIFLGSKDNTYSGTNANYTSNGTFNLTAGTLEAETIGQGAQNGVGTTSRNFNFTGGTLRNAVGSDLAISNVPINLTGSGTRFIEATTSQSITVASTSNMTGSGQGFTKTGAGILILDGAKAYSGATFIDDGTLYVTGALSSSAVTVEEDGSIGSNGANGTLGNGLTIAAGGALDLTGATLAANSSGILSITGGSLTLGNLTFQDLVGWDWMNAAEGTYELIDGAFSVNFGSTAFTSPETAYNFGNGKQGYFTSGSLNAVIIPVPEPSTLALLAAVGGLAGVGLRAARRSR